MAKSALGKGLSALIGTRPPAIRFEAEPGEKVHQASLASIVPSPLQPRKDFARDSLNELVESILQHGIIQPLVVRDVGGRHELIAGERRWRAAQEAGLTEVPVITRVATDLERIGDLAKNMGKRVAALESDFQPLKLIRGLEHMTDLVQSQVKSVLDAYAAHDLPAAMAVWKGDEEIDAICTSLFRELLTYMMEDPRNISFCIHLMFCAKNIERIGDHATNIAETVFYMIEGQQILDKRPKGDMTTFATTVPGN